MYFAGIRLCAGESYINYISIGVVIFVGAVSGRGRNTAQRFDAIAKGRPVVEWWSICPWYS